MGCDTIFVTSGEVEDVYKSFFAIVKEEIDPDAVIRVSPQSFGICGRIGLSFNDKKRSVFFCAHIPDAESDSFSERMLQGNGGVYFSLGADDDAVEIFTLIGSFIGGFCKVNDCDDDGVGEFEIHPSNNKEFPHVRAFFQQELLELVRTMYPNDIVILKTR